MKVIRFAGDKPYEPMTFLVPTKPPQKRKKRYDAAKDGGYKRKQRDKWLAMGIVQPRSDADRAFMRSLANQQRKQASVDSAESAWLMGRAA